MVESYVSRVWAKQGVFGTELADVTFRPDGGEGALSATGVAITVRETGQGGRTLPSPYRVDYYLVAGERSTTRRLIVRTRGKDPQGRVWRRELDLRRAPSGAWSSTTGATGDLDGPPPGGDMAALTGALDCDLDGSPLTNTMPVRRHRLHEGGGPVDLRVAWVSLPDLSIQPSLQRYTFLRREATARVVRFQSLDADTDFQADVRFDADGLVLDYPGIANRVA